MYSIILLVNFKFLSLLRILKDGIGVFNINLLSNPGFYYRNKEYNYLLVWWTIYNPPSLNFIKLLLVLLIDCSQ